MKRPDPRRERKTEKNVCVGEWGGTIPEQCKGGKEIQALAEWMVKNCITNFFWWCLNPFTAYSGNLMSANWDQADEYILALLKYVQNNPTKFILNQNSNEICINSGEFTSPTCSRLFE